jgi:hypothetical protein
MWKFVWADKANLALSAQTNFHIQKCNTCRVLENRSRGICYCTCNGTVPAYSLFCDAPNRKIMKSADSPSTCFGIHHACKRRSVGLDLHACSYELVSCLKGAVGSQICQSGATMSDCLAPVLATNRLASATVIMFSLQNSTCTRSAPTQTGVTKPFLIPLFDSVSVSKHPIILYVCWYFRW